MNPAESEAEASLAERRRHLHRKRRAFWKRRQFWVALVAISVAILLAIWLISKAGSMNRVVD